MSAFGISDILKLTVPERLRLVQDIWDSIAEFPDALVLTEAQKRLLDERLEDLTENPRTGSAWQEVKARLLGSR